MWPIERERCWAGAALERPGKGTQPESICRSGEEGRQAALLLLAGCEPGPRKEERRIVLFLRGLPEHKQDRRSGGPPSSRHPHKTLGFGVGQQRRQAET